MGHNTELCCVRLPFNIPNHRFTCQSVELKLECNRILQQEFPVLYINCNNAFISLPKKEGYVEQAVGAEVAEVAKMSKRWR